MRSRYRVNENEAIYFLTGTVVSWAPAFTTHDDFQIVLDALAHCRREKALRLYAYVLMENHFHLIAEAPDLAGTMKSLKRHTARRIIERATTSGRHWLLDIFATGKKEWKDESKYQVWQEGSHPQQITTPQMFLQKAGYIHNNPVRRGWVESPEHWRYSSARNYILSDQSVLQIDEQPC